MKKTIPFLVALALILSIIGIANAGPFAVGKPSGDSSMYPKSIVVTGSGFFNIGAVCTIDIEYKVDGLKDNVDSEIPIKESQKVPWFYSPRELFYPGCHVVHFKNDKEVRQADPDDGAWKICFGARPELDTKIYYYEDKPESGEREWIALPTTIEDTYACTDALYTGVYMPAGLIQPTPGAGGGEAVGTPTPIVPGSVQPPPPSNFITESGSYSIGGICTLIVVYKWDNLYDDIWVEPLTQDTKTIPFPNDKDVLYLPGCHVIHYEPIYLETTDEMGEWEICFAARPGKDMTIYYYTDDLNSVIPPWTPLPTTTDSGLACAPANWTGVYVPAGR
jgi:hypothetical protein